MPKASFGGVTEARERTLLPDGRYLCVCESAEEVVTKNGDDMWNITYRIIRGPEGAPNPNFEGMRLFDRWVWMPAVYPKIVNGLQAFGLEPDEKEVEWVPRMIVEKAVNIVIKTKENVYKPEGSDEEKKALRNEVVWGGYSAVEEELRKQLSGSGDSSPPEDELPF